MARYFRVVKRTVSYWAPGKYRIGLTLVPSGPPEAASPGLQEIHAGAMTSINWTVAPVAGQLMFSFFTGRSGTDHVPQGDDVWTLLAKANYDSGSTHFSTQIAYRTADGTELSYVINGGGSDDAADMIAKFDANSAALGEAVTYTGTVGAQVMTISGITATGPGFILAGIRIHNFDQPPPDGPTLTPTDGFVVAYYGWGEGGFDHASLGYLPVTEAGDYSLTWTSSNASPAANWTYTIAAVFVGAA